ncbi:uncharacterized protein [Nicotiana sylvestris]|uniref:uncharacterized protein n=1 Tax=Nicotiana sylvestris TaxID=4096 RepID=UPI00388C6889
MVPAPGVPPPAQPARGRGRGVRGGGQVARGGGYPTGGRPKDVVQSGGALPRCYVIPARHEAEASDVVITGTVSVCSRDASVVDSIVVDCIYHAYAVIIGGLETRVDLLLLSMMDFDVILGMDWLSPYHAILDCHAKTVTLKLPGLPRLEWRGTPGHSSSRPGGAQATSSSSSSDSEG